MIVHLLKVICGRVVGIVSTPVPIVRCSTIESTYGVSVLRRYVPTNLPGTIEVQWNSVVGTLLTKDLYITN